jgi:predicted dehydrogenase
MIEMQNNERIKIAVIGCGNMGVNHVRVLKNLSQYFELIGVYDSDHERAQYVATTFFVQAYAHLDELLGKTSAVIIAVPSDFHREIFELCARFGLHIFVEKPIALNVADATKMKQLVESQDIVFMVGHIERYNPVSHELVKIVSQEEPVIFNFQRLSHYDPRVSDTDVIKDLMIHDIDILLSIVPSEVKRVQSIGAIVYSNNYDFVHCLIEFNNGVKASLTASRITEEKIREVKIHAKGAYIIGDYLNRSVCIYRRMSFLPDEVNDASYRQENIMEKVFVPMKEPLVAELEHFANSIETGIQPITGADSAVVALELAEQIKESIGN